MSRASDRINAIAARHGFSHYLEIGVFRGETFLNVRMPHKTGVDPNFAFDTAEHLSPLTTYAPVPSDEFFRTLPERLGERPYVLPEGRPFLFDLIFIDGLHTFEQSFRDFRNSLPYSHERTVWILDDTVPCDPWSAIPDQEKSYRYRGLAGIGGNPWHGDVFKTVFALHDLHPEFRYATQTSNGNPQTIVWKVASPRKAEPVFGGSEEIARLSYFDMLDHAWALLPVDDNVALGMIGMDISPEDFTDPKSVSRLVRPLVAAAR